MNNKTKKKNKESNTKMNKTKTKSYKLPSYIVNMIEELNQLNGRIVRGNQAMTVNNLFSYSSLRLLNKQLDSMSKYRSVLLDRISEALSEEYYLYSLDNETSKSFNEWVSEVLN